jgi:hypothetical protein
MMFPVRIKCDQYTIGLIGWVGSRVYIYLNCRTMSSLMHELFILGNRMKFN